MAWGKFRSQPKTKKQHAISNKEVWKGHAQVKEELQYEERDLIPSINQ